MITPGEVKEAKSKAVGGARKRCRKGKSCSAACIAGLKVCLVNIQLSMSSAINKVSSLITGKGAKGDKKVPLPEGGYRVRSKEPSKKESLAGKSSFLSRAFRGENGKRLVSSLLTLSNSSLPTTSYRDREKIANAQVKNNARFAKILERNLPSNIRAFIAGQIIQMAVKTESGDNVSVHYSPRIGFHFMVNNTHDIGSVKTKEGRVQVALVVRSIYDSVVRSLPEGAVIRTRANMQDGLGERRIDIYNKLGFSLPSVKGGDMFAVKGPGNIVSPSSRETFLAQSGDPDSVYFSERSGQKGAAGTLADWYQIIFGKELKRD